MQEPFGVFEPATDENIDELFAACKLDDTLCPMDIVSTLPKRLLLKQFLDHCCKERTYFLSILKCGKVNCTVCQKPRLNENDFRRLKHLPDPVPGEDKHYKPFDQVFGEVTSEEHMPSLQTAKAILCAKHANKYERKSRYR